MYFVKYGDKYLHDPRVGEELLIDLTLTAEENSCGFCDFTMYPTHPMYMKIKERDADNPVEVYDDDILLFSGFIYELGTEFYQNGNVKCKGELAYLTESIVRPYSTLQNGFGKQAPTSVDGFFEWLITQHNEQVKENKRFTVEINQGSALDSNNYIYRESTKYPTTWSELSEKLLDDPGGFIRIRHENGTRFIDYLSEWTDTNTQVLDFGKNLTDYTQTDDSESVATFIVPLGAKMSDTNYSYNDGYYETSDTTFDKDKEYYTKSDNGYSKVSDDATAFEKGVTYYEYYDTYDESNMSLTISSLEDKEYETDYRKSGDIVYCESAVQKYGWIGATYENTDITTKEALISRGILSLKSKISPLTTIEVKAIDMHLINPDIKPIRIGEYVRVRSKPHNLDSYFLCTNIDLDLNEPENSVYTLGTTFDTLTGQQNKRIKLLNANINQTYEQAEKLTEKEKQNAQSASDALKKAEEAKKKAESAIKIVDVEYYLSTSANKPENGKWQTLAPKWEKGKYIWSRTVTTDGNGNRTYSPDENGVCIAGINGESGADGKGIESIEEQYYKSTSATELIGGSWGTEYPGWKNETYIWTRSVITYTDGTKDITEAICVSGSKGDTGPAGKGITKIEEHYAVSSINSKPPTTWSNSVPELTETNKYLWNYETIHYSDNTTLDTKKRIIGVYGDSGTDGKSIGSVDNYYLATDLSEGITVDSYGWTLTVQSVTSEKKYLWNYEVTRYTDGTVACTTPPCIIGVYGDTGDKGDDGKGIKSSEIAYQVSNSGTKIPNGIWSSTMPSASAEKPYIWTKTVITYTDDTISTIYSVGSTPEGISIGCRNLLLGTSDEPTIISVGQYYTVIGERDISDMKLQSGDVITISVWYKVPSLNSKGIGLRFQTCNTGNDRSGSQTAIYVKPGETKQLILTAVMNDKLLSRKTLQVLAQSENTTATSPTEEITYWGLKLEKGNKATDWTPAPEDSIKSVDVEYYLSDSSTELIGESWSTTAPEWNDGKYMWSRTVIIDGAGNKNYSPNQNGVCIAGAKGDSGNDGKGIRSIIEEYYVSKSATELIGGTWVKEYPGWQNGKYIWTRSVITYTDSTTSITTAICVTGSKGNTGDKGDDGRGIKSTEITYQIHSDGITVPTGEWSTDVPKTTAEKPYLWTRTIITYTDDTTSTMYAVGSTPEGVIDEIQKVLRYDDTKITLGRTGSNITLNLQNDKMSILDGEKDLMDIGLTTEESDGKTWDVAYISSDQILDLSTVNEMRLSATQIMYLKSIEGGIVFDVESYQGQGQPIKFYKGTNFNQGWTQNIPTYDAGNCDSIVDSGYYYIGSSGINRPENTNGWLECMKYSTNYCAQTYTTINGKRYTRYQQNGIWGKWGQVWQSYELFANESQAMNTAIGLNDTAANYDMLEIFYKTNDATQNSTKVYSPNGKLVSLTSMTYVNSASDMIIKSKVVIINGNVINTLNHDTYGYYTGESAIHNGSNPSNKGCDNVGIIRVLGWR